MMRTRSLIRLVVLVGLAAVPAGFFGFSPGEVQADAAFTFSQVDAGAYHNCAVKADGTVACWGWNVYGEATPPDGSDFTQVSAGYQYTCGVKTDGTLACWGDNSSGQATPPAGTFTQVTAGYYHSCGIETDGTLACWGRNDRGQATPPAGTFSQVGAGLWHTCGLRTDSTVACWGGGTYGEATPPGGTFSQVSVGEEDTCGIRTDGTLACWGYNAFGQATPPSGTFTQVGAGVMHNCAVKTDGTLACWGYNNWGQATPPAGTFTQVTAGEMHSCGIETDGTLTCWGSNYHGQATPPTPGPTPTPTITPTPCPGDADCDGVPDAYENLHYCLNSSMPDANADPDGDWLTSLQEYNDGTDPCLSDGDGDGLNDWFELSIGTDPLNSDSDGDGFPDGEERNLGSNPIDNLSTPEHNTVAGTCTDGVDNDGDGLLDSADGGCVGGPPPPDVVIDTGFGSMPDGTTVGIRGLPTTVRKTATAVSVQITVAQIDGVPPVIGPTPMADVSPLGDGTVWEFTYVPPYDWPRQSMTSVTICVDTDGDGQYDNGCQVAGVYLVDPSGRVYDAHTGAPIAGATVTLEGQDPVDSKYVEMSPTVNASMFSPEVNPEVTGEDGRYAWDVADGTYRVQVTKAGCDPATSDPVTVPPPVTTLDVGLICASTGVSVGGIQALPDVAGSASGSSSPPYAALAGAAAIVVVAAGGLYARRRRAS